MQKEKGCQFGTPFFVSICILFKVFIENAERKKVQKVQNIL